MEPWKVFVSISLLFAFCVAEKVAKNEISRPSRDTLKYDNDNSVKESVIHYLSILTSNVKKLSKMKMKSISDKLYLRHRLSRKERRKRGKKSKSSNKKRKKRRKKKRSSKKPKRSKKSKARQKPKAFKVPKIPKLKLPKLELPRKLQPRAKKLPKLKMPKLKVPKLKVPNQLSGVPKIVPKVPKIKLQKSKKTRSRSPKAQKKNKRSRRGVTKKTKRKQTQKPAKTRTKTVAQPSRTPSPRARKAPSPSPSIQKLKKSLELTKKRLAQNIQRQEENKQEKLCKIENYICGKKCSGRSSPRFLCQYPNNVPKFCSRKAAKLGFCDGETGKTCVKSIMEPSLCERNVTITEYCPGAEHGCTTNEVEVGQCLPDKNADECERIKRRKCSYDTRTVKLPCEKSEESCRNCKGKYRIDQCPKSMMERTEVPCPQGKTELPGFEEELLGSGVESQYVRDLLCFSSFFDESLCKNSPRVCRLFDELFDRWFCTKTLCQQCEELLKMHVSEEVKQVCKGLLAGTCLEAGEFNESGVVAEEGKCYKNRMVEKMMPCYEPLPRGMTCDNGCIVKACEKKVHEPKGYCERHLPDSCLAMQNVGCRRETKKVQDCSEERICEYVVKKQYLCFREKRENVPCTGGCENLADEKYVCGSEEVEVEGVCREKLDYSCADVFCSREVCS